MKKKGKTIRVGGNYWSPKFKDDAIEGMRIEIPLNAVDVLVIKLERRQDAIGLFRAARDAMWRFREQDRATLDYVNRVLESATGEKP